MRKLHLSGGEAMVIQELTTSDSSVGESLETERSSLVFSWFERMAVSVGMSLGRRERRAIGLRLDVSVTEGVFGAVDSLRS